MHIASLHVIAPARATSCSRRQQDIRRGPMHSAVLVAAPRRRSRRGISNALDVQRDRGRGRAAAWRVDRRLLHRTVVISMHGGSAR